MRVAFSRYVYFLSFLALTVACVMLLWQTREHPLVVGPLRFDGLGLFFALVALARPLLDTSASIRPTGRLMACVGLSIVGFLQRYTPAIVVVYALIALLSTPPLPFQQLPRFSLRALALALGGIVRAAPLPLAAVCLALGYSVLAVNGALRYDDRSAGGALTSFAFWFILLAAVIPLAQHIFAERQLHFTLNITVVWLYPLVRLYTLGPGTTAGP